MLSTSGLRARVDEKETPSLFSKFASSFVQLIGKGDYLIATDNRPSRNMLLPEVISGVTQQGGNAITLGIVPTPVLLFLVRKGRFSGGLVLTASHNPIEYNGLKFVGPDGLFLSEEAIKRMEDIISHQEKMSPKNKGTHSFNPNLTNLYIDEVVNNRLFSGINFKRFACAIDACNGAAYFLIDKIFEKIGCRSFHIYPPCRAGFPRRPEPAADNLLKLKSFVMAKELDLGIAFDPDGDRVSFVTEEGKALGEELTLPLALEFFLRRRKSPVVTNLSTSLLVDAVAKKYGVATYRTKVGERNVTEEMIRRDAAIGGEGNGGVIIRDINFTRDGILATLTLLALLSEGEKLSEIVEAMPRFIMKKFSFPKEGKIWNYSQASSLAKIGREIKKVLAEEGRVKEESVDGLWLGTESSFFHCRPSNTEPVVRIIICSSHRKVVNKIRDILGDLCVA